MSIMLVYLCILLGMAGLSHQSNPSQDNSATDLKITLSLFRRTPAYANILAGRLDDLFAVVRETIEQGLHYHRQKFAEEAKEIAVKIPKFKLFRVDHDYTPKDEEILGQHMKQYLRRPVKIRNDVRRRGFHFASETADWCIESLSTGQ